MSDIYGVVYFMGAEVSGPVKIGFTSDHTVARRLTQLQTASHEKLVVLGTVSAVPAVEKAIHKTIQANRVRGEWFERGPALSILGRLNNIDTYHRGEFASRLMRFSDLFMGGDTVGDSLECKVAKDLVFDVGRDLATVNTELLLPFRAWLNNQTERDDPTGDLAKDFSSDSRFPSVGSLETYLSHVVDTGVPSQVTRTIITAWIECDVEIERIKYIQ